MKKKLALAVALFCVTVPASASAQVARTWVSQDGSDANDCSFSSPCLSFARATQPLLAGGEINARTDGNFGEFSITQGMTIDGRGHSVGITAFGNGIVINAPGEKVTIRNLHIQGFPGAGDGIAVEAVGHLRLYDMSIRTMDQHGVDFRAAPRPARLTVLNSSISEVTGNAIYLTPSTTSTPGSSKRVLIRNSDISANDGSGVRAGPGDPPVAAPMVIGIFDSTIADNVENGVLALGSQTRVRIAQNVFTGNLGYGIRAMDGGQILTYGNNRNHGNAIDGVPTGTVNEN